MIKIRFPASKYSPFLTGAGILCLLASALPFVNAARLLPKGLSPAETMLSLVLVLHIPFFCAAMIPALLRSRGSMKRLPAILWLRKLTKKDLVFVLKTFFPLFLGISLLSALFNLIGKFFGCPDPGQAVIQIAVRGDWGIFLAVTLPAVLIAPVTEELVFRKVFYCFFRTSLSGFSAAACASILFAVVHATPWQIITFTLLGGVFQTACFYDGRPSVLRSMLLHSLYNLCSVLVILMMRLFWTGA